MRATILTTDVAAVAALIGDRARAAMLQALIREGPLPAGELARRAGVAPTTASTHLGRLEAGGLVSVEPRGRQRYYRLAGPEVAAAVEALGCIAPPVPVRSLRQSEQARVLQEARSCYDHLAGRLGVALHDGLLARDALQPQGGRDYDLTAAGMPLLTAIGVDVEEARRSRRTFARSCLDWSQRRPHLAGALGAALLRAIMANGWMWRDSGRTLRVSKQGYAALERWLERPLGPLDRLQGHVDSSDFSDLGRTNHHPIAFEES
jgi:DNA-binding transcriptional ArsR family regulator